MPVEIVEALEIVDVEHQYRDRRFFAHRARPLARKGFIELAAVGDIGEAVGVREQRVAFLIFGGCIAVEASAGVQRARFEQGQTLVVVSGDVAQADRTEERAAETNRHADLQTIGHFVNDDRSAFGHRAREIVFLVAVQHDLQLTGRRKLCEQNAAARPDFVDGRVAAELLRDAAHQTGSLERVGACGLLNRHGKPPHPA